MVNDITKEEWDVIVIGTGMGGGTAGYTLTKNGAKVLILEKGANITKRAINVESPKDPKLRMNQGWWPHRLSQSKADSKFNRFFASIGCGLAGSSMHYGAALERMDPSDFDSLTINNQTYEKSPVSYETFAPYYDKAENLYGTNKDTDAAWLDRISEWDKKFLDKLRQSNLKPSRLKVAIKYIKGCTECIGRVCERQCKQDAKTACLDKIQHESNCTILENCEVVSINADKNNIQSITAQHNNKTVTLKAKYYILAAGAFHTPKLLLESYNKDWPNGLSNNSGMVGKNLMFHGFDMYAVWGPKKYSTNCIQKKSIAIKDYYYHDGEPLGFIQSMGLNAGRGTISAYLKDLLRRNGIRNEKLLSVLTIVPAYIGSWLLGEATIFAAQIEDFPDPKHRITLTKAEPNGFSFTYQITDELRNRAKKLKKLFKKDIKGWHLIGILPAVEFNSGHACGTCMFGIDPAESVIDANCKSHDIDNLYIADASFMARSGAANPGLTIAANAIRVGEIISKNLNLPLG